MQRSTDVKVLGWQHLLFQHFPSSVAQSEFGGKVLDFRRGEGLCKSICHHVISRTEYKTDFAVFNDPADKMESNVNVFGAWVVLVIFCERDC